MRRRKRQPGRTRAATARISRSDSRGGATGTPMSRTSRCHRLATQLGRTLRTLSARSPQALVRGEPDDAQPSARRHESGQRPQPLLQRQVVEHRHAGDGPEDADFAAQRRVEGIGPAHDGAPDTRQARPGALDGRGIRLDADRLLAHRREPLNQQPLPAADVERPPAAPRGVGHELAVEGRVVVPVGRGARPAHRALLRRGAAAL